MGRERESTPEKLFSRVTSNTARTPRERKEREERERQKEREFERERDTALAQRGSKEATLYICKATGDLEKAPVSRRSPSRSLT
jgi:hypothetical protein